MWGVKVWYPLKMLVLNYKILWGVSNTLLWKCFSRLTLSIHNHLMLQSQVVSFLCSINVIWVLNGRRPRTWLIYFLKPPIKWHWIWNTYGSGLIIKLLRVTLNIMTWMSITISSHFEVYRRGLMQFRVLDVSVPGKRHHYLGLWEYLGANSRGVMNA